MASEPMHIGIIGAGLGGLVAAIAIRRAGPRVTVLEQAAELKEVRSSDFQPPAFTTESVTRLARAYKSPPTQVTSSNDMDYSKSSRPSPSDPMPWSSVPTAMVRSCTLWSWILPRKRNTGAPIFCSIVPNSTRSFWRRRNGLVFK